MKRQRGRGRKPNNSGNRSYESNGPDVKIRGNASQIYEKYLQYARDAQTSGDRINAEAYFQHAEHYFRIMAANAPKERPQNQEDGRDDDQMSSDDDSDNDESENDAEKSSSDNGERRSSRRRSSYRGNNHSDRNEDKAPAAVTGLEVVDADANSDGSSEEAASADNGAEEKSEAPRRRTRSPRRSSKSEAAPSEGGEADDAGLRAMMARSEGDVSSTEAIES